MGFSCAALTGLSFQDLAYHCCKGWFYPDPQV
jgi:hypothetical protein